MSIHIDTISKDVLLDLNSVLADPAGAPLLPISTAAEAVALEPQFSAAANADPTRVDALVLYVKRHPAPVRIYLMSCLMNLENTMSVEAITALVESKHFDDVHATAADLAHVMDHRADLSAEEFTAFRQAGAAGDAGLIDRFHAAPAKPARAPVPIVDETAKPAPSAPRR